MSSVPGPPSHRGTDAPPDSVVNLQVTLAHKGASYAGTVAGMEITNVTVEYPLELAPLFPMGMPADLKFSGQRLKRSVTLSSIVVFRARGESRLRYGFQFRKREGQDPGDIFTIFNRRLAYRAPAVQAIPIEVLPAGAPAAMKPVPADMVDLSATGVGLILSAEGERLLVGGDDLRLAFELPSSAGRLEILAVIRHRRLLHSKAVRYGCQFDPDQRGFTRKEDIITRYVMTYQQQTLKYRGVEDEDK